VARRRAAIFQYYLAFRELPGILRVWKSKDNKKSGGKIMSCQSMAWNWDWVFGGSDGYTASMQVNFSPSNAFAQTSLSVGSPGLGIIGISQYVTRPQPNGPDQYNNLSAVYAGGGGIICYPPIAYDPAMTSVTALLVCGGGDDQMAGSLLVWIFD
jgi:hypothetical protein